MNFHLSFIRSGHRAFAVFYHQEGRNSFVTRSRDSSTGWRTRLSHMEILHKNNEGPWRRRFVSAIGTPWRDSNWARNCWRTKAVRLSKSEKTEGKEKNCAKENMEACMVVRKKIQQFLFQECRRPWSAFMRIITHSAGKDVDQGWNNFDVFE